MRPRRRILIVIVAAVLVAAAAAYGAFVLVGGTSSSLAPVALPSSAPSGRTSAGSPTGTWTVADGSFVGYRVREKLAVLPAPSDAVGRTTSVRGSLTIDGDTITETTVTADLTQLTSDEAMRDERIRERVRRPIASPRSRSS